MQKNLWIIGGVVLALLVAAGIYAATRTNNQQPAKTSTSTSTHASTAPPVSSAPKQTSILQTKTDTSLGSYLATSAGQPLYTYGGDQQGVSNCTGQCLANWPAYPASKSAKLPANVTIITRSDNGMLQYAYKGLPLYTFVGDTSGSPTGDGVDNFHLAKP